MSESLKPIHHHNPEAMDDDQLRAEARIFLAKSPPLQIVAELLGKLRSMQLPWWTSDYTHETWNAMQRMHWYSPRADLRQQITTTLTGLAPKAARKRWPNSQAELVEAVIEGGDITSAQFEEAYDPCDMVVYGPAAEFWWRFRERMPWEEDSATHKKLAAWLMRALLSDRSSIEGLSRRPVLSAWDVRNAIDPAAWQRYLPAEVRVAIDEARLRQERQRPRDPYHARHELAVATPEIITTHTPVAELTMVFAHAEKAMGFEACPTRSQSDVEFLGSPPVASLSILATG